MIHEARDMEEIKCLFERLARGESCTDWLADRYTYCGIIALRKGRITIYVFNDCDDADYVDTIVVSGRAVYKYSDGWGATPEWRAFGEALNVFITRHAKEISRALFGRHYIHERRDPSRIRVTYAGETPVEEKEVEA